ncbi:class V chitinase CHIT5-like [Primulina eburnea]|uniref:class V chitinase CHIT5-like n=1 Tax=Primulina eburnea TaxID=1245227 RepID=UPI003C6BEB39
MDSQKTISLILAFILTFPVTKFSVADVPVPISMPPSKFSGGIPPQMPIVFPPSLPPLPLPSLPPYPGEEPPPTPTTISPTVPVTPSPPSPQMPIAFPPSPVPTPSLSRGIKGAYWPSWLAQSLPPSSIPTSYFTHIFYAFVIPDATSFQLLINRFDEQWMVPFTSALHTATPSSKALLSIGGGSGQSFSDIFSSMVRNPDNRAAFIQSSIDTARKYFFDGLDLDWEFPNNPLDMSNLAILLKEWRTSINQESLTSGKPRLLLSSAVYFSSDVSLDNVARTYPGDSIRSFVDFVNPMCYDYRGGWDTSATGSPALLYDSASDVSTSYGISQWKGDGVPAKKIVMGMPAYGHTWQLQDPNRHGIGDPAVGTGPGGGVMNYSDILEFNSANNATVVFDNATVSTYSYTGTSWIGYDDTISVEYKVKFAKAQGLGGYFFWALGSDSNWTLARTASTAWDTA